MNDPEPQDTPRTTYSFNMLELRIKSETPTIDLEVEFTHEEVDEIMRLYRFKEGMISEHNRKSQGSGATREFFNGMKSYLGIPSYLTLQNRTVSLGIIKETLQKIESFKLAGNFGRHDYFTPEIMGQIETFRTNLTTFYETASGNKLSD